MIAFTMGMVVNAEGTETDPMPPEDNKSEGIMRQTVCPVVAATAAVSTRHRHQLQEEVVHVRTDTRVRA